jgi:hypothetical protein
VRKEPLTIVGPSAGKGVAGPAGNDVVDDTDIETHAVALRGAQRGAHHLKRAILFDEVSKAD